MADIRAAAKALHDSRQALPEYAKRDRWHVEIRARRVDVLSADPNSAWNAQHIAHIGHSAAPVHRPTAEHIARCASPDVTEATQRLLEAIADQQSGAKAGWLDSAIDEAADVLAAAILREDR